jgi:hypothetical protein
MLVKLDEWVKEKNTGQKGAYLCCRPGDFLEPDGLRVMVPPRIDNLIVDKGHMAVYPCSGNLLIQC